MFGFVIWFCLLGILAWSSAQILPLSNYCQQVPTYCNCEAEANWVSMHCQEEYAMRLEFSEDISNIYMSYYGEFDMDSLPRFDIAQLAKFEFDAYVFWPETFLSDLLLKLGIDEVYAIEFRDRRDDMALLQLPLTVPTPGILPPDTEGSGDDGAWLFSAVPALQKFKFESSVSELNEDIFHAFDSISTLQLKLCVQHLPDQLLHSIAHSLKTLLIENSHMLVLEPQLLQDLQRLRNVSLQLNKRGSMLQPRLFASMRDLVEVHLMRATSQIDGYMFQGSNNLRFIRIVDNDLLSWLPPELLQDQVNLTHLDLHNNGISWLPSELFNSLGKLKSLDLSKNKLTNLSSELLKPLVSLQMLNLNFNSLISMESSTFQEVRSLNFIDMVGTQFYGNKLAMPYESLICTNEDVCQYKAETWRCASHCICWVKRKSLELIVDCTGGELEQLPELPHTMLVRTVFKASNNSLTSLPTADTPGYANVTSLYLADNQLSSLDDCTRLPPNLTHLDVQRNRISVFSDDLINYLTKENNTLTLSLAGNPLHCDCGALSLLSFVRAQPQRVKDIGELECASGATKHHKAFQQLDVSDLCPSYVLLISCIVGGIVIVLCLISVVYLMYQQELKIWLYNHNFCLWWVSEEELDKDKVYDAFISYSHKDEDFIAQLLPKLESGIHAFRVCLHGRDWLVGDCIPEQIIRTIADSKRVIIVLSQHFIDSVWARMEFRIAYQATLQDKRKRIIIILYKELDDFNGIDNELRAYLKLNTYLKWDDPLFWNKLRYAMPHNRRILKGQKKHAGTLI